METRFTFGADEHLLGECSEEMSLEAFFKSMNAAELIRKNKITGVSEICAVNTTYMVRFDPGLISPEELLKEIKRIDNESGLTGNSIDTRIVEVPVFYEDPWTRETMNSFRDRHQDPDSTDLEYAARLNGFSSVTEFIESHHGSPWFVSLLGFVCGVPGLYQMVERSRQIEVPKYVRPRTDTPRHTIGHGGCFTAIYAVRGAGGYQMFGITPMQIFNPDCHQSYLEGSMVFFRTGDIVKFRAIDVEEYEHIVDLVRNNLFEPPRVEIRFDLSAFLADRDGYNAGLIGALYGN
ncbi:MAG: carboxyltransferase domain-containing protein [Pseudomonadota bacterium]|nr:carboxyltransferase domain-containing protein [Pseudomonadota bacterium]